MKNKIDLDRVTSITFETVRNHDGIILTVQKFGATFASMGMTVDKLSQFIAAATEARNHAGGLE